MRDEPKSLILNISHEEAERDATTRILREAGYDVLEASTGLEALRLAEAGAQLLLLDVHLPDIDGFEVRRRIKANPRTAAIPVVHLSGSYGTAADRIAALADGADACLTQPVDPLNLLAIVRTSVRLKVAEDALRLRESSFNQAIVDSLPGLFYLFDEHGHLLRWNENLHDVSGYPAGELHGLSVLEFFHESDKSLIVERFQHAFTAGEAVVEATFVSKDLTETPFLFSGRRLLFDGKPCVVGLGINITVSKRAEEALREREERYLLQRNALITLTESDALNSEDMTTAFRRITEEAAKTLDLARVSIWRYGRDRSTIQCGDLYEREANRHTSGVEVTEPDCPSYFRALPEMTVIVSDDARRDPRTCEFSKSYLVPEGITSMMDAPIRLSGVVDGVLRCEHVGALRHWTSDEPAFAVAVANLVSLVLEGWERKRAEEGLRNSENKHRVLFEDSADATMLLDAAGFFDCNSAALQMFGYSNHAEFAALHPADLSPPNQPDGTPSLEAADRRIGAAFQDGKNRFEWVHRRKDGEDFPADVCLTALMLSGRAVLLATVRDTTERTRAEAELRLQGAALNAASDAMLITDRDGTIAWINPAFTALTGYVAGEAIGRNPRDLIRSGVHDQAFYKRLWETILAGNVWRGEMINRRKDGSRHPDEVTITPVKEANGAITHFIAIKRDLTERRHLEAQFLKAQKMEAVGTLAGGIAHDFNNILGAILGCTELAAMDAAGNEAVLKNLAQVTAAGRRATELVQHILQFSGQQALTPQSIHLEPVVREALALLRASLPASIELRSTFDAAAPAVLADPTQVHQIVMNLGINARHAMKDRPGVIETRLDAVDADAKLFGGRLGRFARFSMRDTGHGIDLATQARIFEPFFTTKGPGDGTGLGLATVHGIMKSCQGEILVSSQVGEGTTFQLYFPEIDVASSEVSINREPLPRGHGQHVLFVDDEASLVAWGAGMLERLGYRVTGKSNVVDALAAVTERAHAFDVVITDMTMPVMTGIQFAERVRAVRPDMPVILTTGYSAAMTSEAVHQFGIEALLVKPIALKTLAETVHRVLQRGN
jgi:PAS domain S-box-containing protein